MKHDSRLKNEFTTEGFSCRKLVQIDQLTIEITQHSWISKSETLASAPNSNLKFCQCTGNTHAWSYLSWHTASFPAVRVLVSVRLCVHAAQSITATAGPRHCTLPSTHRHLLITCTEYTLHHKFSPLDQLYHPVPAETLVPPLCHHPSVPCTCFDFWVFIFSVR